MRQLKFFLLLMLMVPFALVAQPPSGADPQTVNRLPDYIPPSPEATALFKADELGVNYATGSPNINIPLGNLSLHNFNLAIGLSYNSTGIRVDEYSSMVGMGWEIHYGGVISRTVLGKEDENRSSTNNNLTAPSFLVQNAALLNFLENAQDKESDIFSISLPGVSAKFILDSLNQPVFLSNVNCKIAVINSNFTNGFIVTTDDGTTYYFEDAEISQTRNPTGTNCEKAYAGGSVKTSWYLSRIELPNRRKTIFFTYTTTAITSESSISQTVSRVIATENYPCIVYPTGAACPVGNERFSTCIYIQAITAKLISSIVTSDGDRADFIYDTNDRTDLLGGKRLKTVKLTNRYNRLIRKVDFHGAYIQSSTSSTASREKRLFLDSLVISNNAGTVIKKMRYDFKYINYGSLPARLSYGQDWYGYSNGKNSNASLIPTLKSSDINYSTFNNGTAATSVTFGNRSVDTVYAIKGLLCKIIYPTGGYDTIQYSPNKIDTGQLAGGNSVNKITSYTGSGLKALEKTFIYRFKDSAYSGLVLNSGMRYSDRNTVKKSGYLCDSSTVCSGPSCTFAVVTSNSIVPLSPMGSQHLYHRSVLVYQNGTSGTNGMIEHKYSVYSNTDPHHLMNNRVLSCPLPIFNDVLLGETETNVYKSNGASYTLLNKKKIHLRNAGFTYTNNYSVKKGFDMWCSHNPVLSVDFEPYDVDEYPINRFTVLTDSIVETDYSNSSKPLVTKQSYYYNFPAYTYPNQITINQSDGSLQKITRKYPPDGSYSFMTNRNIVSPVLEERNYRDNTLLSSVVNTFVDYFSNTKNIVLQSKELKRDSSIQINKFLFNSYDTLNNVQELQQVYDQRISYIWDYNYNFPVAKIINALTGHTAYTSFEADGKGNWSFAGATSYDSTCPTGLKYYNLSGGSISKSGLTSSKSYIVSYWSKNSSYTVSGSSSLVTGKTINGWTYYQHIVTGVSSTTLSGSGYIDEIRLYPADAQMTTYTYEPMVGTTSQCDINNVVTYFEYDVLGRLNLIRDQDKNLVKKFCYNYAGQPEECESVVFYNQPKSQSFMRTNCGPNYNGGPITYTVPANKYSSSLSVEDANQQALADISANGQAYANTYGPCIPICTSENCSGENKKCVFGLCETGVKVYTSVVRVHGSLWECTYHWHWSDGSNSQDYTESGPVPCVED